jgi:hypothetical protein
LLGVLYDAVGTEGHETLCIAAEVGEELVGMIGTEYLADLRGLR